MESKSKKMDVRELGDSLFSKELENFVKCQPYMAFVNLSALLEFIARCKYQKRDNDYKTGDLCANAINSIKALEKYKTMNYETEEKKMSNYLYKSIRCGMLHSILPKKEVILNAGANDLDNKVVGALELYGDIQKAWDELKKTIELQEYLETDVLNISGTFSGSTQTSIVQDETLQLTGSGK